jgi:hypothetical protein
MRSRVPRLLILTLCTAAAWTVSGRAPGAINLRTRDIETVISADGKAGRELKSRYAWHGRAGR